jgi:hypothetical protein
MGGLDILGKRHPKSAHSWQIKPALDYAKYSASICRFRRNCNKITITGLDGKTGKITVELFSTVSSPSVIAGLGDISNGSATVPLKQVDRTVTDWTGTGSYFLEIYINSGSDITPYFYTDGKTFEELGISNLSNSEDIKKLPQISITDTTTTIALGKFYKVYPIN